MFFRLVATALLTSLSASAAAILQAVTPDQLPSLAASGTNFIIASGLYGSELNVANGLMEDGASVIVYRQSAASEINQQVSPLPTSAI